jgi:hypothetical protein
MDTETDSKKRKSGESKSHFMIRTGTPTNPRATPAIQEQFPYLRSKTVNQSKAEANSILL